VLDIVAMMRRVVDAYEACVLLGELSLSIERLVAYDGVEGSGVHLPGNFHLDRVDEVVQGMLTLRGDEGVILEPA
jgi:hypothetical protein